MELQCLSTEILHQNLWKWDFLNQKICLKQGLRNRFKSRGACFSNPYKAVNKLREVLQFRVFLKIEGCNCTHLTETLFIVLFTRQILSNCALIGTFKRDSLWKFIVMQCR